MIDSRAQSEVGRSHVVAVSTVDTTLFCAARSESMSFRSLLAAIGVRVVFAASSFAEAQQVGKVQRIVRVSARRARRDPEA